MTDAARLPFPLPPIVFLIALIIGVGLGVLYPLPWFGDVLGDILFGFGWLAALGAVALWFTAIRMMYRARTPLNPARSSRDSAARDAEMPAFKSPLPRPQTALSMTGAPNGSSRSVPAQCSRQPST